MLCLFTHAHKNKDIKPKKIAWPQPAQGYFIFQEKITCVSEPGLLPTAEYPIKIRLAASVQFRSLTQREHLSWPCFCDEYLITSSVV